MPNRLSDQEYDEVSLVDSGASPEANILIFKRDVSKGEPTVQDLEEGDEDEAANEWPKKKRRKKKDDEDEEVEDTKKTVWKRVLDFLVGEESGDNSLSKSMSRTIPVSDDLEPEGNTSMTKTQTKKTANDEDIITVPEEVLKSLPAPVQEYISKMEEYANDLEAKVTKGTAGGTDDGKPAAADASTTTEVGKSESDADDTEAILKNADPAVAALVRKMQADTASAHEIAKAEREARLDREFISKAEGFGNIPMAAGELGPVLKSLHEASPDVAKQVETLLTTVNTALGQSEVFAEFGKSFGGEATASMQAEAKAKEMVEKGDYKTKEQALAAIYKADPTMYDREIAGQ